MAKFDQIPNSDQELMDIMRRAQVDQSHAKELLAAYQYTKDNNKNIQSPFAMSLQSITKVKVLRGICTDELLSRLKQTSSYFKFTPGDGSRTKKGFGSAGITFENILGKDIQEYIAAGTDADIDTKNMKFIRELWNHYKLDRAKEIHIDAEAGLKRYRRSLQISSGLVSFSDGLDVGLKVDRKSTRLNSSH